MRISVVAASREDDRPPTEAVAVASLADRLGYGEVWLGEGPTWDAYVLATAVGLATERIAITVGPVPVSVRDPVTIARGAAGAEALTGRAIGVALGTSSVRVVEGVHGRSRARAATVLAEVTEAVRPLLGPSAAPEWPMLTANGFRRRLPPASGPLTVAAFGDRAIATAARYADRMLLDLVTPEQVRVCADLPPRHDGRMHTSWSVVVPAARARVRSPSATTASASARESRTKGRTVRVPAGRSIRHVPLAMPSTRTVWSTRSPTHTRRRTSSVMIRVRSAYASSRLSKPASRRTGAGLSGSGRGASGRSYRSRPDSSRKVRSSPPMPATTSRSPLTPDQARMSAVPAGVGDQGVEIDPSGTRGPGAPVRPRQHRGDHRAQPPEVAGADQVLGGAQQTRAYQAAVLDRGGQVGQSEAG